MTHQPTHLHITATPKRFQERGVVRSLEKMHHVSRLSRLGVCMNGPHWASMTPKRWRIKVFFASTEGLIDYERLLQGYGYLKELAKYCKGGDEGVELTVL